MATAVFAGATFAQGAVFINGNYDTTTLKMVSVDWQNLTDRQASMTVHGPSNFQRLYQLLPRTAQTSVDVTANNIVLVKTTGINPKTGQPGESISLPVGWSLSFNYG